MNTTSSTVLSQRSEDLIINADLYQSTFPHKLSFLIIYYLERASCTVPNHRTLKQPDFEFKINTTYYTVLSQEAISFHDTRESNSTLLRLTLLLILSLPASRLFLGGSNLFLRLCLAHLLVCGRHTDRIMRFRRSKSR